MDNQFIISTTNNIEGGTVKKYIDMICTNIVIGTNVFSDFAASFTDFFGGRSNSYKKKLGIIYNEALKDLKSKAKELNANAIIGARVDFDEISGKDKSMFMVSISGTACVVDYKGGYIEKKSEGIINQSDLDNEILRRCIIREINNGEEIQEEWEEFLFENPQIDIVDNLLDRFISMYKEYQSNRDTMNFIIQYFSILPKKEIVGEVYSKYIDHPKEIRNLIIESKLFDSDKIIELCSEDIHKAIKLLCSTKDYYDHGDVNNMNNICSMLNSLPDTGKIELVKGGLLSKEQEKYICENGHKNSKDTDFCFSCGLNIKGLNEIEVKAIKDFTNRTLVLDSMLNPDICN